MPHPWVANVAFKDNHLILRIELDISMANQAIEISGYVTQNGGGFATIYDIQSVGKTPDGRVEMYVTATPAKAFQNGEDVTATLRASRVWVTVLKESQDGQTAPRYDPESTPPGPAAKDGTSWSSLRAVGWASPDPSSASSDDQTPASSDYIFRSE